MAKEEIIMSKKAKEQKTNVMRLLDKAKVSYSSYSYVDSGVISGIDVANVLNENPNKVFKTLVTVGKSREHYTFVIPVNKTLDLKNAARAVSEKSICMIKSKELLSLTGYIHGGCSPIGMKKNFVTVFDESAKKFDTIFFSAGKIGYQVEVNVNDLCSLIDFTYYDLTE